MADDDKTRLQALLDAALAPLKKQLDEQGTRLEKLDTPTGTESLRKAEIPPYTPIVPLQKVNGHGHPFIGHVPLH